jgi:hypothetical protein
MKVCDSCHQSKIRCSFAGEKKAKGKAKSNSADESPQPPQAGTSKAVKPKVESQSTEQKILPVDMVSSQDQRESEEGLEQIKELAAQFREFHKHLFTVPATLAAMNLRMNILDDMNSRVNALFQHVEQTRQQNLSGGSMSLATDWTKIRENSNSVMAAAGSPTSPSMSLPNPIAISAELSNPSDIQVDERLSALNVNPLQKGPIIAPDAEGSFAIDAQVLGGVDPEILVGDRESTTSEEEYVDDAEDGMETDD